MCSDTYIDGCESSLSHKYRNMKQSPSHYMNCLFPPRLIDATVPHSVICNGTVLPQNFLEKSISQKVPLVKRMYKSQKALLNALLIVYLRDSLYLVTEVDW